MGILDFVKEAGEELPSSLGQLGRRENEMKRILCVVLFVALCGAWGCSKEEVSSAAENAKEAVISAAESAQETAGEAMDSAKETASGAMDSAKEAASGAMDSAKEAADGAAGSVAGALAADPSPGDLCRGLAEKGAWDEALEVCKQALAVAPDDLELQHAVQQAEAAAE